MHLNTPIESGEQAARNARPQSHWAAAIRESWSKSTAGIIATGALLIEAREELDRDVFNAMRLPFGRRTAQRLMAIAANPVLATHVSQLPPSWGTLYELSKLPDAVLLAKIEDGTVRPDMERREVAALLGRPKKPATAPKPDLLTAWDAATPEVRRVLFERLGLQILELISNSVRDELVELLERHRMTAAGSSSNSLALNLTQYIRIALSSDKPGERDAALAGINRKLKAAGRDLHDVAITLIKKSRKSKR